MTDFNDLLNEQMKDPEFKAEWDELDPEFAAIEAEKPNATTAAALDEYAEMQQHPEKYKRYSSFKDAVADISDPFYSEQNIERLHKSIAEMETTGGTVHEILSITDSLTGTLQEDKAVNAAKAEHLSQKYGIK